MSVLPYAVAGWMLLVGLYGVATSRHLVHLVLCLGIMQAATYVLLLAIGYRTGAASPILIGLTAHTPTVDPVVQALTLTDVVVEATVSALLLAIAIQIDKRFGSVDPDELRTRRG